LATGFHVIETLVDDVVVWTRPVGEADGHSAEAAGVARLARRIAAADADATVRGIERMEPPGEDVTDVTRVAEGTLARFHAS
jgi:hypothetical protein